MKKQYVLLSLGFVLSAQTALGYNYQSPFQSKTDSHAKICAWHVQNAQQLLTQFSVMAAQYNNEAKDPATSQTLGNDEIKRRLKEMDQWAMDLIATRNCLSDQSSRDTFDKAITDATAVRTQIQASRD